MNKFAAHLIT